MGRGRFRARRAQCPPGVYTVLCRMTQLAHLAAGSPCHFNVDGIKRLGLPGNLAAQRKFDIYAVYGSSEASDGDLALRLHSAAVGSTSMGCISSRLSSSAEGLGVSAVGTCQATMKRVQRKCSMGFSGERESPLTASTASTRAQIGTTSVSHPGPGSILSMTWTKVGKDSWVMSYSYHQVEALLARDLLRCNRIAVTEQRSEPR